MSLHSNPITHALFGGYPTLDSGSVIQILAAIEKELFPDEADVAYLRTIVEEVAAMFRGEFVYFQAMDTPYHDFEHTLQATVCWAQILYHYQRESGRHRISHAFFRIGLVAVLLHDIGYLKEEHDEQGTGAKFTFVHERRSCELAHICLHASGWSQHDIFAVQHIISCTGPRAAIQTIPFRHRLERIVGQMVCTADYLGQLADPHYVEKIPQLYAEFEESDDYRAIPRSRRLFKSLDALYAGTPDFWKGHVLPRLEEECQGLYRFLSYPYPEGRNPYIEAVEQNLERIQSWADHR